MVNYKIFLASNSPRRRELLRSICPDYEVRVIEDIDESFPSSLPAEVVPIYISQKKAESYKETLKDGELVITADTIVVLGNDILGKPENEKAAIAMLNALSGHTHLVVTGVTLTTNQKQRSFACVTEVDFDILSDEDIQHYVSQYKPYDKAGAYGIQEWIGYIGVTAIRGSYFNVMGLPVQRLYKELQQFTKS